MIDQKPLGRSGNTISAIGLGAVTFGREIDEETSYQLMDYALDKGINWLDTAEIYGGGQSQSGRRESLGVNDQREITTEISSSENIIGRWFDKTGNRNEVTLCTKVSSGGDPDNVRRAVGDSLERLRTDHIDIYKLHNHSADVPISETLDALSEEVNSGRIGVIGCSNFSATQLQESLETSSSHGYPRFEIIQPAYNLVLRDGEDDLFPLCNKEGIAITPHSPLGNGFLTGKYTTDKTNIPKGTRMDISPGHMDLYWNDRGWRVDQGLRNKSTELGIPIVRLAMAWVMTNPHVTSAIIGVREASHIDNALDAYTMGLGQELRAEMSSWSN